MKRILVIIALALLAVSCGRQSDTCTIKGVVKGAYKADGATVSAALMAASIVSKSRISPTRITSGS